MHNVLLVILVSLKKTMCPFNLEKVHFKEKIFEGFLVHFIKFFSLNTHLILGQSAIFLWFPRVSRETLIESLSLKQEIEHFANQILMSILIWEYL